MPLRLSAQECQVQNVQVAFCALSVQGKTVFCGMTTYKACIPVTSILKVNSAWARSSGGLLVYSSRHHAHGKVKRCNWCDDSRDQLDSILSSFVFPNHVLNVV